MEFHCIISYILSSSDTQEVTLPTVSSLIIISYQIFCLGYKPFTVQFMSIVQCIKLKGMKNSSPGMKNLFKGIPFSQKDKMRT